LAGREFTGRLLGSSPSYPVLLPSPKPVAESAVVLVLLLVIDKTAPHFDLKAVMYIAGVAMFRIVGGPYRSAVRVGFLQALCGTWL
jgi:hypothetical protein